MLKAKWKVFAIDQSFSHEPTPTEALALFDALHECDTWEAMEHVMEKAKAIPWFPYEFMETLDFVAQIESLARCAQNVERLE